MLREVVLALLLVGACYSQEELARANIAKPRSDNVNYRLPGNVVPTRYTVTLKPDFDTERFTGSVKIEILVKNETNRIVLHKREIEMPPKEKFTVTGLSKKELYQVEHVGEVGEKPEQEFFQIILNKNLQKDKTYILHIEKFKGILNNDNYGFYLAKYRDGNGTIRKFATTHFEPTSARRAFPCFDEPALKAKFTIKLIRPSHYNSISNMPKVNTCRSLDDDNTEEDTFEETVVMSTYLVAFIVSEMKLSDPSKFHRVLAKPEDLALGKEQFALDTAEIVLKKTEEFVGVDYALEKMDQAAIPDNYFRAGAMENWGLVTYKESLLLYAPESTSSNRHQRIATIIAHEFGHQWFGNLVSPEWWNYIWLNEGFATYFGFWGASQLFNSMISKQAQPEWKLMDQFVVKNTQFAFQPDSMETTRAMNSDAGSPAEISALFDRIAYQKSGSVIRMMEMFLTTEIFKKGLNYYLTDRAYKVAAPEHLYNSMQQAVNEATKKVLPDHLSVQKIMRSWDSTEGYPVVNVIRKYNNKNIVWLKQSRYLRDKLISNITRTWIIPINFATNSKRNFDVTVADIWLTRKLARVTVGNLSDSDWIIINKRQTGYYRVNYDAINWHLLTKALLENHTNIDLLNRAQLIDDSFNLAQSRRLPHIYPFELSLYLSKETEYVPFYSFFNAASFLNTKLSGTASYNKFKAYVRKLLVGISNHLGFEEKHTDKHIDKLNRVTVVSWLCNLGDSKCRTMAFKKFKAWITESKSIPINLQAPIFCGAMREADQDDWNSLYDVYKGLENYTDPHKWILNTLGCSEDVQILEGFLEKAIVNDSAIDTKYVFESVYNAGVTGVQTAFNYILNNFESVHSKLKSELSKILHGIGKRLTTREQFEKLEALSQKHAEQAYLFTDALKAAQRNVKWNDHHLPAIDNWLNKSSDPVVATNTHRYNFLV